MGSLFHILQNHTRAQYVLVINAASFLVTCQAKKRPFSRSHWATEGFRNSNDHLPIILQYLCCFETRRWANWPKRHHLWSQGNNWFPKSTFLTFQSNYITLHVWIIHKFLHAKYKLQQIIYFVTYKLVPMIILKDVYKNKKIKRCRKQNTVFHCWKSIK